MKKKGVCASQSCRDKSGSFLGLRRYQIKFGPDRPEPEQLERVLCIASVSSTSGRIKNLGL